MNKKKYRAIFVEGLKMLLPFWLVDPGGCVVASFATERQAKYSCLIQNRILRATTNAYLNNN